MGKLEGKVVIVTGGAKGIGRGIALASAKEGADIVIAEINLEEAEKTAKEIRALNRKAIVVKNDVRNSKEVEAMVKKTLDEFGKIDALVNNAGTCVPGTMEDLFKLQSPLEIEEQDWDTTFDTNLKGIFLCCKYVIPHMRNQKSGKIINISSSAGTMSGNQLIPYYAASKAAVINYTGSLALLLADYGITANAICPHFVWTDLWKNAVGGEQNKALFDKIVQTQSLLKRETTPEKIGALAVFLMSEDGDDITAQAIVVGR
ncbi:MAG: SDR family NAD(P)-dependent oxidoreductase [Candidatus Jordarchaeum sp.]|uniref:SDR family NAD(P)-dependent oxidoreductase n=1 Tax=Candidatus Jordarchaeum sp. TaxID=2823881 RepID=UPI00404A3326